MDEEGDAERAAQWDLAAADAAYKAQVEAALAQQRAVEEEHRLLLEQLEVLLIIIMTHLQTACCFFSSRPTYGLHVAYPCLALHPVLEEAACY